ncbi:MAG: winged helix-turn-helix transcriptional regulator, partial [Egibacteraceae bacterium]
LLGLAAGAAQTAWSLLTEPDDTDADPLLAALRGCEPATSGELADALDLDVTQVRARLTKLIADGTVTRTGHARTTRYHTGPIRPR